MPDHLSSQQRHKCMSHIRSENTKPEMRLRAELFRRGIRYRINVRRLPGSPDIVLRKYRTCIFVNGCFWHGHKGCSKFVEPRTNAEFWRTKVLNNRERDQRNYRDLEALGWRVIVVWECELERKTLDDTVARVLQQMQDNRRSYELEMEDRRSRREEWRLEIKRRKEREKEILRSLSPVLTD